MQIRDALASDVSDILRLSIELHEHSATGVPSRLRIAERYDDESRRAYADKVLSDANATYLVAVDGGDLIGYAEIHLREAEQDPAVVPVRRAHLQALVVTAGRRQEGVGGLLLKASEDWARAHDADELELDNWIFGGDPGRFYEHAGYAAISEMRVTRLE